MLVKAIYSGEHGNMGLVKGKVYDLYIKDFEDAITFGVYISGGPDEPILYRDIVSFFVNWRLA